MTSKPIDLSAARALCEKATPGPWSTDSDGIDAKCVVLDANDMWVADCGEAPFDAAFIVASREFVPQLIAEVERLREEIEDLTQSLDGSAIQAWRNECGRIERSAAEITRRVREQKAELRSQLATAIEANAKQREADIREGFELAVDCAVMCHEATCEHDNAESHLNWTEARRELEDRIHQLAAIGHASEGK